MKSTKSRYQQGSITRVPRAKGFVWQVRFSERVKGKRWQKCLTFSGLDYPTEASVRKAIETAVVQQNVETQRPKVDARFGAIIALYQKEHLPTLQHSTQELQKYLFRRYIEPKFKDELIRNVTPLNPLELLS